MWTVIAAVNLFFSSSYLLQFDASLWSPLATENNWMKNSSTLTNHYETAVANLSNTPQRLKPIASCAAALFHQIEVSDETLMTVSSNNWKILALCGKNLSTIIPKTSADVEYEGLILCLSILEAYFDNIQPESTNVSSVKIIIEGDCKTIIDQLNHKSSPRKQTKYYDKVTNHLESIERTIETKFKSSSSSLQTQFIFHHIPRNENMLCDYMSSCISKGIHIRNIQDFVQSIDQLYDYTLMQQQLPSIKGKGNVLSSSAVAVSQLPVFGLVSNLKLKDQSQQSSCIPTQYHLPFLLHIIYVSWYQRKQILNHDSINHELTIIEITLLYLGEILLELNDMKGQNVAIGNLIKNHDLEQIQGSDSCINLHIFSLLLILSSFRHLNMKVEAIKLMKRFPCIQSILLPERNDNSNSTNEYMEPSTTRRQRNNSLSSYSLQEVDNLIESFLVKSWDKYAKNLLQEIRQRQEYSDWSTYLEVTMDDRMSVLPDKFLNDDNLSVLNEWYHQMLHLLFSDRIEKNEFRCFLLRTITPSKQ